MVHALGLSRQRRPEEVPVSAYVVANYTVTNPEGLESYGPHATASITRHGGEILAADFESEAIEGEPGHATVVIRFPDAASAKAWYSSHDYQKVVDRRLDNSFGMMILVCGSTEAERILAG